mmetsp:Transcript_34556/g.55610  ORF Transcript_34556/g.55610 Transcript_34556/m.55610 type:complete len:232 (+) Transcript_34556:141-836(+)
MHETHYSAYATVAFGMLGLYISATHPQTRGLNYRAVEKITASLTLSIGSAVTWISNTPEPWTEILWWSLHLLAAGCLIVVTFLFRIEQSTDGRRLNDRNPSPLGSRGVLLSTIWTGCSVNWGAVAISDYIASEPYKYFLQHAGLVIAVSYGVFLESDLALFPNPNVWIGTIMAAFNSRFFFDHLTKPFIGTIYSLQMTTSEAMALFRHVGSSQIPLSFLAAIAMSIWHELT